MAEGRTKIFADEVRDADPKAVMNVKHNRGLHSRVENVLLKSENQMPEMWKEGSICYVDGRIVSEKVYNEILAKYKPK